jgi:hypothetical protein
MVEARDLHGPFSRIEWRRQIATAGGGELVHESSLPRYSAGPARLRRLFPLLLLLLLFLLFLQHENSIA